MTMNGNFHHHPNHNPSHRRGPWSQHEDNHLLQLVGNQGALNWVRISQILGTRTPKQCRERYHQNLKPSLSHDPITPEEGRLIERLVNTMGKRWAEIARQLPGRSDNAVKNWWNGSQNRRKRQDKRRNQPIDSMYDDRHVEPTHYPRGGVDMHPSLPMLPSRPAPLPLQVPSYHEGRYEPPLISPSTYTTTSELAPSPRESDSGSRFSASPRSYPQTTVERLDLPPIRIPTEAPSYSPRTMPGSPGECALPPITHVINNSPASYTTYAEYPRAEQSCRLPPMNPPSNYHRTDYFGGSRSPYSSHLPTAPSSPVNIPRSGSGYVPYHEEITSRADYSHQRNPPTNGTQGRCPSRDRHDGRDNHRAPGQ